MSIKQNTINALTLIRNEKPRFFNNPIIGRELTTQLRKKQSFVRLFMFMFLCVFIFSLWWHGVVTSLYNFQKSQVRDFFSFFSIMVASFSIVIVPMISATSVNIEIERETWDLIRTTPINLASLLLGKFLSSVFFILLIVISVIPIFSMIMPLGGVSPQEIGVFFLTVTEAIVITALIGLICSIRFKRAIVSISLTYVLCFLYFAVLPFVRTFLANEEWPVEWMLSPFTLSLALINPPGYFTAETTIFIHYVITVLVMFLLLMVCAWMFYPSAKGNVDRFIEKCFRLTDRLTGVKAALYYSILFLGAITLFSLKTSYTTPLFNTSEYLQYNLFVFLVVLFLPFLLLFLWFYAPVRFCLDWRHQNWEELETTPRNLRRFLFNKFKPPIVKTLNLGLMFFPCYLMLIVFKPEMLGNLAFVWFLYIQEVSIVTAIALYCSLKWDNLLVASIQTIIRTLVYHLVFFFVSPFIIFFAFIFRNLQYDYSFWLDNYLFWIIGVIIVTIVFLVVMILLCQREVLRLSKRFERESIWQWFKRTLTNVIPERKHTPDPVPTEPYPDGKNPLWVQGIRSFYTYNRSRFWRITAYLLFGSLFVFLFGGSGIFYFQPGRSTIWRGCSSIPVFILFIIPFFILPYACDSFRGEKDRSTWDVLRTTTLTPAKLFWGKFQLGLWLLSCRFWAFFAFVFIAGTTFRFTCSDKYTFMVPMLESYLWNSILILYAYGVLLLSIGMYFSSRISKTTNVFTASYGAAFLILFGCYILTIMNPHTDFAASFSPLLLLMSHEAVHPRRLSDWHVNRTFHVMLSFLMAYIFYRLTILRIQTKE